MPISRTVLQCVSAVLVWIALTTSIVAFAQPSSRRAAVCAESPEQSASRTQKPRQVSGTIVDMKTVAVRGSGTENLVVLLRTNKGDRRLVVDLGPTDRIASANLAQNRRIAVEGIVKNIGSYPVLVAQRLKIDNRMVAIERARGDRAASNVEYATPPAPAHPAPHAAPPPAEHPGYPPAAPTGHPASMPTPIPPGSSPPSGQPPYAPPSNPGAGSPPGYY